MGCATSTQDDDPRSSLLGTDNVNHQNEEIKEDSNESEPDLNNQIPKIILSPSQTSWVSHQKPETTDIADRLVQIGDSIWYSTKYDEGEKGMVEYCLIKNRVKQIVGYPKSVKPSGHCICAVNNIIYIIGGSNQVDVNDWEYHSYEISSFNPSTGQFTPKKRIFSYDDHIGDSPSVITVGDLIYIYHGSYDDNKKEYVSYVYNPSTNELKEINDKFAATNATYDISIIKYKNQLIRFGGINRDGYDDDDQEFRLTTFLFGYAINDIISGYLHEIKEQCEIIPSDIVETIWKFYNNNYDQIYEWRQCDELKLEGRSNDYGYVLYEHYLIIFNSEFEHNVRILDLLNTGRGWINSDIKRPGENAGSFRAIVTSNRDVHLFVQMWGYDGYNSTEGHYSIPLSLILKDFDNK